jgi:hypothetical protein
MRRYPALLWILVFVGSVITLNGGQSAGGGFSTPQLVIGIGMITAALVASTWLALGPWPGHPRPSGIQWMYLGVVAFYVICAIAALVLVDGATAVATMLAGFIPLTAVGLWMAHVRLKTRPARSGDHDVAAADHTDAVPGFGVDDVRPMGDTPDAHDEISPHDLPKGHPGRPAAERQAEELDAPSTPGHEDGAATDLGPHADGGELVTEEEQREGSKLRRS